MCFLQDLWETLPGKTTQKLCWLFKDILTATSRFTKTVNTEGKGDFEESFGNEDGENNTSNDYDLLNSSGNVRV